MNTRTSRVLRSLNLGYVLWGSFGLLLFFCGGQSVLVGMRVAGLEEASNEAIAGIQQVSLEIEEMRQATARTEDAVTQTADRVRSEMAEEMQAGQAEMKVLERNVVLAVESIGEIVGKLEEVLDEANLDDDTAGVIEDLLFDADDSYDQIRKKALPLVRSGVERLGRTSATSQEIASEVGGFTTAISASADRAVAVADEAKSQITDEAQLASGVRWLTVQAAVAVFVVGVGIPLVVVPRISREVSRAVNALNRVAAGDLRSEYRAKSFDEFVRLSEGLGVVSATVGRLNQEIMSLAKAAKQGDLNYRADDSGFEGSFRKLVAGLNETVDAFATPAEEAAGVMSRVAEGDLHARMQGDYSGMFAELQHSINDALGALDESLSRVYATTSVVADAARDVDGESNQLASGTQEQAASVTDWAMIERDWRTFCVEKYASSVVEPSQ